MSEIKFRAWHEMAKCWLDMFIITNDGKVMALELGYGFHGGMVSGITEHVILEQFTGLHDKNGKDIYGGDVVRDEDGYKWKVAWGDSGLWQLVGGTKAEMLGAFCMSCIHWCTVIGNIHENPELLEAGG